MLTVIFQFFRWVFEKFAAGVLIVGLGLAACGLWLFLKDNVDFDQWRQEVVRTIDGERTRTKAALDDVHKRMDRIAAEITAEQEKGKQVDKILATLKDLESTWDKYTGQAEQQKTNAERITNLTAMRVTITAKVAALQQVFTRTTGERDGLELALGKVEAKLAEVKEQESKVMHYVERTWNYEVGRAPIRLPLRIWAMIALGLYFVGPTIGKLWMYYFVAPWIAGGRPVRLGTGPGVLPTVSESKVATSVTLRPGERLWVKEKFLQASDEGLKRKSRYVLDWTIPFTCFATGLVELIEMSHRGESGEAQLTLSNQGDPHSEIAVITLPEGASLVLRPSFLAGVVTTQGQRLKIRRRWQLFRWQAWVTLQFRFFEFVGPCQLVVAGSRGVRVEQLLQRDDGSFAARRTNQDATMGFTPGLDYRPTRAETFWSYYRGMNPLFDDLFAGQGIFLCQQVSMAGDAKKARKFWAGVWGGFMKIFGM
ncbi:MAG: hypothetical protein NTV51_29945 [Verrucomicrobia bacterium]|nr:hypothetical protein [Verrucomicrobiota bacterium]